MKTKSRFTSRSLSQWLLAVNHPVRNPAVHKPMHGFLSRHCAKRAILFLVAGWPFSRYRRVHVAYFAESIFTTLINEAATTSPISTSVSR